MCVYALADINVVYETPARVFTSLSSGTVSSSVKLCDYLFQDESALEAVERFKELLGVDVKEGDIDMTVERIPGKFI